MKHILITVLLSISFQTFSLDIYTIPGLSVDSRVYAKITFPDSVNVIHLEHQPLFGPIAMKEYAKRMSYHIDTTKPFALIGLSLGGMTAVEMTHYISPAFIVLISSVEHPDELPNRYRILRSLPIHKLTENWMMKTAAVLLPVVMPVEMEDALLYSSMVYDCSGKQFSGEVSLVVNWQTDRRTGVPVYRIHGEKDPIIPIAQENSIDYVIEGGMHKLLVTHNDEVNKALAEIIKKGAR